MTHDALKASIAEIKAQMERALGSKEKDLLGDILRGMLSQDEVKVPDNHETLAQQLDAAAVDFEMDHPKLAQTLREVSDTLNKMGV